MHRKGHTSNPQQLGWNCFDIAAGIDRQELVNFALNKANDPQFRKLLAPEIRSAGMLAYIYMSLKDKDEEATEKRITELYGILGALTDEDKNKINQALKEIKQVSKSGPKPTDHDLFRHALPESMHTDQLYNIFQNYSLADEKMKNAVAQCNDLLGYGVGKRKPIQELENLFAKNRNRRQYSNPYDMKYSNAYNIFNQAREQVLNPAREAIHNYCESKEIYEQYVTVYYGHEGWVSFQKSFINEDETNTSMVDIAARMLEATLIILEPTDSDYKEIYRTNNNGKREIKIIYNYKFKHFTNLEAEESKPDLHLPTHGSTSPATFNNEILSQQGYLVSLKVKEKYGYINLPDNFEWVSPIPMFTVITGKNGVGKSSLLQAILDGFTKNTTNKHVTLEFKDDIKPQICSLKNTSNDVSTLNKTIEEESQKILQEELETRFQELIKYAFDKLISNSNPPLQYHEKRTMYDGVINDAVNLLKSENKFDFANLEIELRKKYIANHDLHIANYNSFSILINHIMEKIYAAELEKFKEQEKAVESSFNLINEHLLKHHFKYTISKSSYSQNNNQRKFESISFCIPNSENYISPSDLSAGERIEFMVLLWQFTKRNQNQTGIILLDEPDAHLHPSLVKEIIDIIKIKLVHEMRLQVIMTTHNPITISFIPRECLFLMENNPPNFFPQIKQVANKREAINILSGNLIYINEPFAVVFVEGEIDKIFYSILANRLNDARLINMQIAFKVHGQGETSDYSNCDMVKNLIKKMTEGKNGEALSQFIFGIIDGDNKKHGPSNNLKAVNRYSVENYIFDPINLFICLCYINQRVKAESESKEYNSLDPCNQAFIASLKDMGFGEDNFDLSEFTKLQLQTIISTYSNRLKTEIQKAIQHRGEHYTTVSNIIQEHTTEYKSESSSESSSELQVLIANIRKKPKEKIEMLRQYFLALQQRLEKNINETNEDVFNISAIFAFDDKNELFKTNEDIAATLNTYFTQLKNAVKNHQKNSYDKFINSISEREITLINGAGEIDWQTTQTENVSLILKNKIVFNNIRLELEYPRILLYLRGHNLQTCYEKIFKIPHGLANDFPYILETTQSILIPEDLINIYKSMTDSLNKSAAQSPGEQLFSQAGEIPFFKAITDKSKLTEKRIKDQLIHQQAQEKINKSGISDDALGFNLFQEESDRKEEELATTPSPR